MTYYDRLMNNFSTKVHTKQYFENFKKKFLHQIDLFVNNIIITELFMDDTGLRDVIKNDFKKILKEELLNCKNFGEVYDFLGYIAIFNDRYEIEI